MAGDRRLICPNGDGPMHQVVTRSRHGAELLLDQCGGCGGVWFDKYELFRIGEAEARQVEGIDKEKLRYPTGTGASLLCPVCGVTLVSFQDANIPENIQLLSCPKCSGFWVNHGQLSSYADFRVSRGHKEPDPELAAEYEKMLRAESKKDYWRGMEGFGHQLGGQRDFLTGLPLDGSPAQLASIDQAQDYFYTMLGVAARLLFWWL